MKLLPALVMLSAAAYAAPSKDVLAQARAWAASASFALPEKPLVVAGYDCGRGYACESPDPEHERAQAAARRRALNPDPAPSRICHRSGAVSHCSDGTIEYHTELAPGTESTIRSDGSNCLTHGSAGGCSDGTSPARR